MNAFPPVEQAYLAAIDERRGDLPGARAHYQDFLDALTTPHADGSDRRPGLLSDDISGFVKYQMDGLSLKEHHKDFNRLMPVFTLSSITARLTASQFLTMLFVPHMNVEMLTAGTHGAADHVRQTAANPGNMFLDLFLIISTSAGSVTEDSEEAMQAYLLKYPDSYWSLFLGGTFYKYYIQNGEHQKADGLLKELTRRAKTRGVELVGVVPDTRYFSPEETWNEYLQALKQGDVERAMACYAPGRQKHRQVFEALGVEQMKTLGDTMGRIEKIKGGEREAEYVITRSENGKEHGYFIHFYKIDGEWKMGEF